MTDVFLQKSLVDETKKILEGYTSLNNGEALAFNVYPQNLPAKKGKEDKDHFPYVLICLDEEVISGEEDDNICSVYFLVGIEDKNENKQGHFDVANVLNLISKRFIENRLIGGKYRIGFPITKKFQEEDTWPKFFGGMTTLWSVNKPMIKETEYD